MKFLEKWIYAAQILASIGLMIPFFLPFYKTVMGKVEYAYQWPQLFFWPIFVVGLIYVISNRWLKAVFCLLSAIGSLIPLVLLTFAATFKSSPLIGFYVAQISIIFLAISWLVLCIEQLTKDWTLKTETGEQE